MTPVSRRFNNYLRLYRRKNGLSQKEMAHLMGYKTTTSISNYERGSKMPQLTNLLKLEIILHTPIAFLFRDHFEELKREVRQKEKMLHKKLSRRDEK